MGRAPCCDKANVKKGPWSTEEDAKLKAYIEKYGTGNNWIALPQKIGRYIFSLSWLKRCGKSCRLRWLNYLRPNIKHGGFSEEEDNIICSLYISIGSRWSIIAAQLPGRTDNDIKNYWNTRLKKKLLGRRKDSHSCRLNHDPNGVNAVHDNSNSHTLSNSAIERMQLHMQLQNLQDPLSFFNNPALWPKLHPFSERNMIQQQVTNTQIEPSHNEGFNQLPNASFEFQPSNSENSNPIQDGLVNSFDGFSSSKSSGIPYNICSNGIEQFNTNFQSQSSLQAELSNLVYNKTSGLVSNGNEMTEFDCIKEMGQSTKESAVWWANDFDTKSSTSNSWDSAYVLPNEGMFQDYVLAGYNM
ncbi:hypothetical protein GIB67_022571 [Kingdonia uniflora]|uniref:Uncharacterized protein n=1 Tax=Kingdonia uniflora TaxID=39325 RepID=A0A7J7L7D2_9MAGN|nr:hypothetical protein GIB67_022571 [Kingdonia uniflora]